ncbi:MULTISPECIES: discoidin domain-containing protein [unclassified Bacillus (in: firmicutes)]|uniref:discoidin domain-containing protein n=1 Tax=unclassified Bacillus (in: firmicutes) TaxID=185979 RepID=UPI0030100F9E
MNNRKNRRLQKPIKVLATSAILATTLFTPIMTNNLSVHADTTATQQVNLSSPTFDVSSLKTMSASDIIAMTSDATNLSKILQAQFITQSGGTEKLQAFANRGPAYAQGLNWLMSNNDVLNTYLQGGVPSGDPMKSLEILVKLWVADKDIANQTSNGVYLRMAMAVALDFSKPITTWEATSVAADGSGVHSEIDPVSRYLKFKKMQQNGKLFTSFNGYDVVHMRMVVDTSLTDADIDYIQDYVRSRIGTEKFNSAGIQLDQSHISNVLWLLPYQDKNPNNNNASVHEGSDKFFGVPWNLSNVLRDGGVCGTISMFGSQVAKAFGVPASVYGQPGHAAMSYMGVQDDGKFYWQLNNDITGWGQSVSTWYQPWGTDFLISGGPNFSPSYINTYENATNHTGAMTPTVTTQEQLRFLANYLISQDANAANNIRSAALTLDQAGQPNFPLWADYIRGLVKQGNTTSAQWSTINDQVMKQFANDPRALYDLVRLYKDQLINNNDTNKQNLMTQLNNTLANVKSTPNNAERQMLTTVRSEIEKDGLALLSIYAVSSKENDSSQAAINAIDGDPSTFWHNKWDQSDKNPYITLKLNKSQTISSLTYLPRQDNGSNGNITSYNIYTSLDGTNFTKVASGNWADDSTKKTATFANTNAQYVKLEVVAGHSGYASAAEIAVTSAQPYVLPKNTMTASASSVESQDSASKAIDGKSDTFWHSSWVANQYPYNLTLQLDNNKTISQVDYLPRQDGSENGRILNYNIYTSVDGTKYDKVTSGTWENNADKKSVKFDPVTAKYVKVEVTNGQNGFASAAEVDIWGY